MNDITYAVSVDVNNPIIPYNVYVASVLDSNVRYLEVTLYENGNVITLSNTATATASLVTDNVLVDDSVECTISNNIITVPLEDLQRHGNLDVQVTVTEGEKVLAIPFPIQVRVTPNIAENAQIDENSLGSYAEVVREIAEARGDYETLNLRIAAATSPEAIYEIIQDYLIEHPIKEIAGFVFPEMFGAKGDGETDDTLAVQVAINYAIQYNSDNEHNHVAFKGKPDSRYMISSPIDIIMPNSTYLYGEFDFQGAELVVKNDVELQYVLKYHNPAANHNDVHSKGGIRNLTINGNLESAHTGLYITCCSAALFEKINIYDCRRGIYLTNINSGETIIRDCTSRRNIMLDLYNQLDSGNLKLDGVFAESGRGEELNTEDKINLVKTQCVGFEITCDDAFIENCVAIDHVIGVKLSGGDNKVIGCHPWNMALNQLKSSCCFFTNGGNYFVNNTCDRFHIGIYNRFNVPNFYVNTLFTNQALNSSDNSDTPNYCWYLDPTYAAKTKGQVINAVNTKVNGNTRQWERDLYWCNTDDYRINDSGTTGHHLLGYRPSKIEDGYLAKVESVAGNIPIDTDCKYAAYQVKPNESPVTNGASNGVLTANGCRFISYTDGTSFYHRIISSSSQTVRFLIKKDHFTEGRRYLICFKYSANRDNVNVKILNTDIILRPFTDSVKGLIGDGVTRTYYNVFTATATTSVGIGFDYGTYASGDILTVSDVCVFDVTDVPRYFMENGTAYAARLYAHCGITTDDVPVLANTEVSFKALKLPVNMDNSDNTLVVDHDYYDIGYDNCGRAKFHPKVTYIPEVKEDLQADPPVEGVKSNNLNNYALLTADAQSVAVDVMVINAVKSPFKAKTNNFGSSVRRNDQGDIVSLHAQNNLGMLYGYDQMPVAFRYLPDQTENDFTPISFRFGKTLGCDDPVVDSGGLLPVYNRGEVYAVKKGCKPWEQEQSPLPTVLYQITPVEDGTISAGGGSQIVSGVVNQNGTITFTDSDRNTFTTTGASVIGPQGDPGQDYVLTNQDKSDIADIVLGELPTTEGVLYGNTSD